MDSLLLMCFFDYGREEELERLDGRSSDLGLEGGNKVVEKERVKNGESQKWRQTSRRSFGIKKKKNVIIDVDVTMRVRLPDFIP